ncbi:hypothetical protein [Leptospira stimsonii]|nr:hypothetical protein [Leptospira stimsonii]
MKKILTLSVCILILTCKGGNVQFQESINHGRWVKEINLIKKDLLKIGSWDVINNGPSLKFSESNAKYVLESEPIVILNGTYLINNDKIFVKFKKDENYDTRVDLESIECLPSFKPDHLYPQKYLSCEFKDFDGKLEKFDLFDIRSAAAGNEIKIDGISVESTGYRLGNTTTDVYFRKSPSLKGKVIPYSEINISDCPIDMLSEEHAKEEFRAKDRIPEGRDFWILAKTVVTDKIENWENVWYYIKYRSSCMSEYKEVNGWIYGQFVNFIKDSN